ncbi:MAG: 3-oxoacyl-ACP synthase III [Verrucomicrobiota bacterium]
MRYTNVCVEAISHVLPPTILTSTELERQLEPLYQRLKLPHGRLELMTGIRERRFWKPGTRPSDVSAQAGAKALEAAGRDPEFVDCVLHCGVSRDAVEPATSTEVHRQLGLSGRALNFDLSNACLGVLSGMLMVAGMIELGQITCGLVVTGEDARPLVESTVRELNENTSFTRKTIKPHFASLSIGSAASAVLLTHRRASNAGHRLLGGASWSNTTQNALCRGGESGAVSAGGGPLMATDSEALLERGVEVAKQTWRRLEETLGWTSDTPDLVCTHQVGKAHTIRLFEELGLDPVRNFATFSYLGNCGSASLPLTASIAAQEGALADGDKLALLGIGSGINCTMLGVQW